MTEVEFRLPSAVPYAYVNVKGTLEELVEVNFEMLASLYANSLTAFQTAEVQAAKLIVQGGALGAMAAGEPEQTIKAESADGAQIISETLGATELDNVNAPWEAPPKAPKKNPWDKSKPAPVADLDLEGW